MVLSCLCWKFYLIHAFVLSTGTLQTNRLSKNNLIGYCEVDLVEVLSRVTFLFSNLQFFFIFCICNLMSTLYLSILLHDFLVMHKLLVFVQSCVLHHVYKILLCTIICTVNFFFFFLQPKKDIGLVIFC